MSEQRFVYSTSFSTTVAPGLRVGVFILPEGLAGELTTSANDTYITPALLGQATVFEFMRRGSLDAHVERLAEQLKERRDRLVAALEEHLPEAEWTPPEGGIFLMLRLEPGLDAKAVLAGAEGVTAHAGSDFFGLPSTLRLNYAEVGLDEIEPGIERLAAAVAAAPQPD
jgi:DNA-binding transcriptional MocR family regulator